MRRSKKRRIRKNNRINLLSKNKNKRSKSQREEDLRRLLRPILDLLLDLKEEPTHVLPLLRSVPRMSSSPSLRTSLRLCLARTELA
jgi:hypothetical protein